MREEWTVEVCGLSRPPAGSGNPSANVRPSDASPPHPVRSPIHHSSIIIHHSGFTLLELLLVLVVLGFCTAIAAARLGSMRSATGVDQAVRQVVAQARRCQALARSTSQPVRLRFDLDQHLANVTVLAVAGSTTTSSNPADGGMPQVDLLDGVDALGATWTGSDGVAITSGQVDLLFMPDGRNEAPGTLTLALTNDPERGVGVSIPAALPAGRVP